MDRKSAYRQLVRYGLRATQWKAPYRYVYINTLRKKYRSGVVVEDSALNNTVQFVANAALHHGMELTILQGMIHTEYTRWKEHSRIVRQMNKVGKDELRLETFGNFDATVDALNKTMNLAL